MNLVHIGIALVVLGLVAGYLEDSGSTTLTSLNSSLPNGINVSSICFLGGGGLLAYDGLKHKL